MGEVVTPSQLRQDIYRLIDRVLATGEPLEISRKGRRLRLVPDEPPGDRLAAIVTNPTVIVGDPEELVSFARVVDVASDVTFTRDPFDRLITAAAIAAKGRLATKDAHIRAAYPDCATWD